MEVEAEVGSLSLVGSALFPKLQWRGGDLELASHRDQDPMNPGLSTLNSGL